MNPEVYTTQIHPQYLPLLFLNTDLRNIKQTIKNPIAATPPTARATVLSACGFPPDPNQQYHASKFYSY